jgi:endonuclease/exonuclease/phosphatase (EEP) superfamily protein YafD
MQIPSRERKLIRHLPRRRAQSTLGFGVVCLGWLIVGFLGLVILVRAVAWDRWQGFAELDAAIEVLFLPAWVVLLGGLFGKRWWLAGAAALICLAQIVYVAPEVLASNPIPATVRSEPTVRLFDANVYQNNYSMAGYIKQLKSYRPEILTMEETMPGDYAQLKNAGVLATLPYQYQIECCGSRGFIIASHYPLKHVVVSSVEGEAYLIRTSLVLPNRTINLWVVHTTAPTDPGVGVWNLELDGIYKQLETSRPRPLLMVGDFNATWGNRGFRAILSTGLTDAAAARGDPFDFTWSQLLPLLPPIIRIDHVLTAGAITVTTIATHPGPGSDHRDITATVATASAARTRATGR